jgi:hypothetical protein
MIRGFKGLSSIRRNATVAVLLSALLLGTAPAFGQAVRTPYSEKIDTGVHARVNLAPQNRQDVADFVVGNMPFVLMHEMAHVHVTEMGLPVLGREEDAADSFAIIALLSSAQK